MELPVTGVPLVDWALGLLATYGYLVVFMASALENIFIVGSFTPGEILIMATAFVAANGRLSIVPVFLLAVAGGIVGNNISYILGRRGGRAALDRYGHRFHISQKRIADTERYFAIHGSKTVFLARFAAVVKNFAPMLAGISKMPVAWFEGYTVAGQFIYCLALVLVGWIFGENFERAVAFLQGLGYGAFVLVALIVVALVAIERRRKRRREAELGEDAAAGPPREPGPGEDGDAPR